MRKYDTLRDLLLSFSFTSLYVGVDHQVRCEVLHLNILSPFKYFLHESMTNIQYARKPK